MRIATRGSALALAQARSVADALGRAGVSSELVVVTTSGDRGAQAGAPRDKGRWVDSIEQALLDGRADLAVHSAKDVPAQLAEGTILIGSPPREDPRDALLGELRPGARVGTSSLRRRAQLLARHRDVEVVELRGNVDTRLARLGDGAVDAAILALAGLRRLGRDQGAQPLDFVPAAGQGTLALQARAGTAEIAIADAGTSACLAAERAVVRVLRADCDSAVGAHCVADPAGWRLSAWVGAPDGTAWVSDELAGAEPQALGETVARRLLAAGAGAFL